MICRVTKMMNLKMNRLSLFFWLVSLILNCKADSVEYAGIGNFTTDDFLHPLWRPIVLLPESPEHIDPTFSLYTHLNINDEQRLTYNDADTLRKTNFDPNNETKIIVHGFLDNKFLGTWEVDLKNEFLKKDRYNVILVDWHKGNLFPYHQAAANTRVVGPMIAILIQNLCKVFNATLDSFHVMGHSLGSHIAGYAGKFLKGELGHITGFDPAGPLFEGIVAEGRLWYTDAKFVESIHSDARHIFPTFGFGMYETCSHVDIYPNGGKMQPGCNQKRIITFAIEGIVEGFRQLVACNHIRSIDYYIESINNILSEPKAYQCDNYESFLEGKCHDCGADGSKCAYLGPQSIEYKKYIKYDANLSPNKRFFLQTAFEKPFLRYQYFINITMGKVWENVFSESGSIMLTFVSNDKNEESFYLKSNGDIGYLFGQNEFQKLLVLNTNPDQLIAIKLQWSHGIVDMVIGGTMYVQYIDLIVLNRNPTTVANGQLMSAKTIRFTPENNAIPSNQPVTFLNKTSIFHTN